MGGFRIRIPRRARLQNSRYILALEERWTMGGRQKRRWEGRRQRYRRRQGQRQWQRKGG